MTSNDPTIAAYMTTAPHAIEPHEPVAAALQRMRELNVLHLPVRAAGRTVGVLSERDLGVLEAAMRGPEAVRGLKTLKVMDVMTPDPFCARPGMSLREVAAAMAERKIGSALVVDDAGRLLGIFTVTDALKALATLA